jgi:hypothetical protein
MPLLREALRSRAMADERASTSTDNADVSMVGCYRLLPVSQSSGAVGSAKSATMPLLRLTDSTSLSAERTDNRRREPRDAIAPPFIGYATGLGGASSVRWNAVANGLVRLQLTDGATLQVRLAADTSRLAGRADRVDYTALRTRCP